MAGCPPLQMARACQCVDGCMCVDAGLAQSAEPGWDCCCLNGQPIPCGCLTVFAGRVGLSPRDSTLRCRSRDGGSGMGRVEDDAGLPSRTWLRPGPDWGPTDWARPTSRDRDASRSKDKKGRGLMISILSAPGSGGQPRLQHFAVSRSIHGFSALTDRFPVL